MRKLMFFSIGFATACGLCAYLLHPEFHNTAMAVCIIAGMIVMLLSGRGRSYRCMFLVLLGCGAGFFWFSQYSRQYLSLVMPLDGTTQISAIRATDFGYESAYGTAFDGSVDVGGKKFQVKTYLNETTAIGPGEVVSGTFRFRVTAPDSAEASTYYQGKGIFLLAYQQGEISVRATEETWQDAVARLRQRLKEIIRTSFPEDIFSFAQALLLGDSGDLSYAVDTDFKLSGIRHVIAVSGFHVSILFALISTVTVHRRYLTALLGFPALFFIAALAGFTPSVCRACIMSGLMLLSMLTEREYDGATALSFAVLVMLLFNPLAITSVSLQLSAASVGGIYLFQVPVRNWILSLLEVKGKGRTAGRMISWFAASVSISLSAMALTTPLCAVYFGTVSLVGVITNLLTLWVISGIFYGILMTCLLGFCFPTGAKLLALALSLPIRFVLKTAHILADIPLAAVYTRSFYIAAWVVFLYVLLTLFLRIKKKRPLIFVCCAAIGLCAALMASWAEPLTSNLRFSVLDVGQGQCLLLQYRDKNILVDCGGDSDSKAADIAAETLLSQGILKLDCMILTHLDRDHAGGAANLLARMETELLILPPEASTISQYTDGKVLYADEDLCLSADGLNVEIFTAEFPGNSNEMSLCILFQTEKCDILITGDRNGFGERSLLRNHTIPDVDILVAGHHGSKNSTCEELLQAVRPEIVCISVGEDNSYGHPAPELLQRLQNYNCTIYRTDIHGTVLIRR